jgi:hypothetical protein
MDGISMSVEEARMRIQEIDCRLDVLKGLLDEKTLSYINAIYDLRNERSYYLEQKNDLYLQQIKLNK